MIGCYQKNGQNLSPKTVEGMTPFLYAAQGGFLGLCQLLVENGTDMYPRSNRAESCMHLAVQSGNVEFVEIFLEAGMAVDELTAYGEAPIHLCCQLRDVTQFVQVLNLLLRYHVNLAGTFSIGNNLRHHHAVFG
ncbi:MAG: hypothetical protein M1830_006913, partial [Pleopsidium flavum]